MKSAWELALERSGGALQELSPEKKEKIAELERAAQAKIAAAKITAEHKLASMTDPDEIEQLKDGLVNEIRSNPRITSSVPASASPATSRCGAPWGSAACQRPRKKAATSRPRAVSPRRTPNSTGPTWKSSPRLSPRRSHNHEKRMGTCPRTQRRSPA